MSSLLGVLAILLAALISPAIIKVLEDRLLYSRRRAEARYKFQFETALALQEAIRELQVVTAKIYLAKVRLVDNGGKWPSGSQFSEFQSELSNANSRTTMLAERVVDESLRAEIKLLWSAYSEVVQAKDRDSSGTALQHTIHLHRTANDKLGAYLRSQ